MSVFDNIIKHPAEFLAYKKERQVEKNALIQSGIMVNTPELDSIASSHGRTFIIPFNKPLSGTPTPIVKGQPIVSSGVNSAKQVGIQQFYGQGFDVHDLESMISGDDKMGFVANYIADYWNKFYNSSVSNLLVGAFASASMASNIHETSEDAGYNAILEGVHVLGDRASDVGVLVINSATELKLQKEQFNNYIPSKLTDTGLGSYMNGRFQVIVDDVIPNDVIYVLGAGAVSWGDGTPSLEESGTKAVEVDRNAKYSESSFYSREKFILHLNGVSWVGTAANEYADQSEIIVGTNWNRVFDPKNVPAVKIVLNVVE